MKVKLKDGKEIEVEETDVLKAVQEEYEKKLKESNGKIEEIKKKNEEEKEALRKEHVKQMRAILTGRKEELNDPEKENPFDEEDEEEMLVKKAKEFYKQGR